MKLYTLSLCSFSYCATLSAAFSYFPCCLILSFGLFPPLEVPSLLFTELLLSTQILSHTRSVGGLCRFSHLIFPFLLDQGTVCVA